MSYKFNDNDINRISELLCCEPDVIDNNRTWSLRNVESDKPMHVSLYNDVQLADGMSGSLVSVQTRHGYYELHNLSGYILFEPDEVIFISQQEEVVSTLIIGKGNTCSLFSNIRKDLLGICFAELDPAVLLSAMQVSIVENYV